jgi:predicted AAA+ superfamily ATPase
VFLEARSVIARMMPRRVISARTPTLAKAPALALPGPLQVGKTTLALDLAHTRPAGRPDLKPSAN